MQFNHTTVTRASKLTRPFRRMIAAMRSPHIDAAAIEVLEQRRLLSVSAATLVGPVTTTGATWSNETLADGEVISTNTETVVGSATFNGQSCIESDETSNESSGTIVVTSKNYSNLNSSGYLDYGRTDTEVEDGELFATTAAVFSPPEVYLPPSLTAGTPYTESSTETETISGGGAGTDVLQQSQTLTLQSAQQSVTVPAGTYDAYVVDSSTTTTSTFTIADESPIVTGPTTTTAVIYFAAGVGDVDFVVDGNSTELTHFSGSGGGGGGGGSNELAFTQQPVNTTPTGTFGPVVVDVENSSGTLLSSDESTVTLSLNGNPSVTLGGTTSVAAVNGVATFSDLAVPTPGTYTLTASDGSDTPALSTSFSVFSAPEMVGGFNLSFGVNGLASHDVGFSGTAALAQDGTQSVIVGPIGSAPDATFGITRYNADGSLDTTFGSGGVVSAIFGSTSDVPTAIDVLPGGQILVAGTATTYTGGVASGSEFAIAEYNANGTPDASFGGGTGQMLISFSSTAGALTDDVLGAMTVNSAGVIYLGGSSSAGESSGTQFAIAALSAAGALETGFGTGGKVLLDFAAGGDDMVNALALQKNGDLVAAGSAAIGGVTQVALARFLPTGLPDKHFGTDGKVTTSVRGLYDSASSLVIQTNGAIVIAGASATGSGATLSTDFLLARYTSSGHLDKSFAGGTVITSFGQPSAVTQLTLDSDGDIIASGKTTASLGSVVGNELEVAIARYTDRGALDTTFNGTGKTIVDLSGDPVGASDSQVAAEIVLVPLDSGLGAQFDQFVGSEQGVVSMTPGGDILDAGNSGANTVEAEIITAGVDLAAALLTQPPASVTGGFKGTATVQVAEDGTLTADGTISIELQVSSSSQGSGGTTATTVSEHINLKRLQDHSYKLSFDYPQNLTAGDYYLVAVVNNGSSPALQDLNLENNTAVSTSAVDIAPPFVSLVASGLSSTSKFDPGKPVAVTFTVDNNGNVTAKGTTTIELVLSTDQIAADGTTVDTANLPVNQPAGKSKVYHVSFKLPTTVAPAAYYLIAVLDPLDDLGSIDHTSSTAVDPTQVTVG